jgi:hypothetical protein
MDYIAIVTQKLKLKLRLDSLQMFYLTHTEEGPNIIIFNVWHFEYDHTHNG